MPVTFLRVLDQHVRANESEFEAGEAPDTGRTIEAPVHASRVLSRDLRSVYLSATPFAISRDVFRASEKRHSNRIKIQ